MEVSRFERMTLAKKAAEDGVSEIAAAMQPPWPHSEEDRIKSAIICLRRALEWLESITWEKTNG